jgi:hypothetical protein
VSIHSPSTLEMNGTRRTAERAANTVAVRPLLWATVFCTLLCASCGSSQSSSPSGSGASAHSSTEDMLCFSSTDTQKVVISRVFPIRPYPPERMVEEPWAQDFRRYIGQSGNAGGINVTCSPVNSSDAEKSKAEELRKQGHTVVETNWSYAGG